MKEYTLKLQRNGIWRERSSVEHFQSFQCVVFHRCKRRLVGISIWATASVEYLRLLFYCDQPSKVIDFTS